MPVFALSCTTMSRKGGGAMDAFRYAGHPEMRAPSAPEQGQSLNFIDGWVSEFTELQRLRRFLTIGIDGYSYEAKPRKLEIDDLGVLRRMAQFEPDALVSTIVEVAERGTATKSEPILFALAYAASLSDSSRAALAALPRVARTGADILQFAGYVEQFRGWGRGLRRAVGGWYAGKDADEVAVQVARHRRVGGWSHRDLLRLAHPVTADKAMRAAFDWIARGTVGEGVPRLLEGVTRAVTETNPAVCARLVHEYGLSWEMLPAAALDEPVIWDALLDVGVPQPDLMRELPRLTRLGLLSDSGSRTEDVAAQLKNEGRMAAARVHPVSVVMAQRHYAAGQAKDGERNWHPTARIIEALDEAFHSAYCAVEPTGKRTLVALDVSRQMNEAAGDTGLSAREASVAMMVCQLGTEPGASAFYFTDHIGRTQTWERIRPLDTSLGQRFNDALRYIEELPFWGCYAAGPMLYALENSLEIDTFVIYTDKPHWGGRIDPHRALRLYRRASGIPAKLIVLGLASRGFYIADPNDAGMLDVFGFDETVPHVISAFSSGR